MSDAGPYPFVPAKPATTDTPEVVEHVGFRAWLAFQVEVECNAPSGQTAARKLADVLDRFDASGMPTIWEDPAGKGYPCFERPMTPAEAKAAMERDEETIVRLGEALEIGERFLNACFSAWSCGEPTHRVRAMLDRADEFRAALNKIDAELRRYEAVRA